MGECTCALTDVCECERVYECTCVNVGVRMCVCANTCVHVYVCGRCHPSRRRRVPQSEGREGTVTVVRALCPIPSFSF